MGKNRKIRLNHASLRRISKEICTAGEWIGR